MSVDVAEPRTELAPRSDLEVFLFNRKAEMEAVLPKHLTPERLIKIASAAVSKSDLLKKCTPLSIVVAVMTSAQLGLDCGGALGSAYLVPFKKNKKVDGQWQSWYECQLIIGYRGLIDLARRSGHIVSIESRVVYQNDEFDVQYTREGVQLHHKPCLDSDPGDMRLVYGLATLKGGGHQFEMMTRTQIDGIRARSMAKDNGPWVTDYDEMARKTVVKRLSKSLPLSTEFQEAIIVDNRNEYGSDEVPTSTAPVGAAALNAKLRPQLPAPSSDDLPQLEDDRDHETNHDAEPPESDDTPRPRDVSTWPLFKGAMEAHRKSIDGDMEKYDAMMKWIGMNNPDVKKDTKPGQAARESFYRDFLAGKPINGVTFGGANG